MTRYHFTSVALIVLLLVLPFIDVKACGPDFEPDTFIHKTYPDDKQSFAQGQLGILQSGFDSDDLTVAYRYLSGGKLSDQERRAYDPASQPVKDWSKLTADQIAAARQAEEENQPVTQWKHTRAKYLNRRSGNRPGAYDF